MRNLTAVIAAMMPLPIAGAATAQSPFSGSLIRAVAASGV